MCELLIKILLLIYFMKTKYDINILCKSVVNRKDKYHHHLIWVHVSLMFPEPASTQAPDPMLYLHDIQ